MNRILVSLLFFASIQGMAQSFDDRLNLDPRYFPFYHGVASGDPTSDAVIIWTRVTPDTLIGDIAVRWRMATDTGMVNTIASGAFVTGAERDFTVKVDVQGLQPAKVYYYDFEALGRFSIRGRTKTTPRADEVDHLRFGVVSCSSYEHGYFNAYRQLVNRNDVDAILHLGDYIYEYEVGAYGNDIEGRTYLPEGEIILLDDYRLRYSHYRLDPDLRAIHQQYAFISTWDDHETADNAFKDGAVNHTEGEEGNWQERKALAIRAYKEWMPVRDFDSTAIQHKVSYGDLADIYVLETRLEARDQQAASGSTDILSEERRLIGDDQYNWLTAEMKSSTATWNILAQQVMFAPLRIAGVPFNNDQWDGYEFERSRLLEFTENNGIDNMIVLTGDIHTSWANDIPTALYEPLAQSGSAGVEFVCTSVTSPGLDIPLADQVVMANNPHVQYVDLVKKGFMILHLNTNEAQGDWYYTDVRKPVEQEDFGVGYKTFFGSKHLTRADGPAEKPVPGDTPAPDQPVNGFVGIEEVEQLIVFGVYPNPFDHEFVVQFLAETTEPVEVVLLDAAGRQMQRVQKPVQGVGVNYLKVTSRNLPAGIYYLSLKAGNKAIGRTIIKK